MSPDPWGRPDGSVEFGAGLLNFDKLRSDLTLETMFKQMQKQGNFLDPEAELAYEIPKQQIGSGIVCKEKRREEQSRADGEGRVVVLPSDGEIPIPHGEGEETQQNEIGVATRSAGRLYRGARGRGRGRPQRPGRVRWLTADPVYTLGSRYVCAHRPAHQVSSLSGPRD